MTESKVGIGTGMAGAQVHPPLTYNLGLRSSGLTLVQEEGSLQSRWSHPINDRTVIQEVDQHLCKKWYRVFPGANRTGQIELIKGGWEDNRDPEVEIFPGSLFSLFLINYMV